MDNPGFEAGDTVFVKRGVYDEGGASANGTYSVTNRVYITKKVTLKAVDGPEVTSIVGKWGSGTYGAGTDAFRCVFVGSKATESVIEGFTLRDGAAMWKNDGGSYSTREGSLGPALYVSGKAKNVYLVGCKVVNCSGNYSGALYGATAIRCIFDQCRAHRGSVVFVGSYAFGCAITRSLTGNSAASLVDAGSVAVGCSFVANKLVTVTPTIGTIYNCVLAGNPVSETLEGANAFDSALLASGPDGAFATGFDDFRLPSTSAALETAANPDHRQVLVDLGVPEAYLDKDLRGDTIDWSSETLRVGAVQAVATPAIATVSVTAKTIVNGRAVDSDQWLCAEVFPTTLRLAPSNASKPFFGFTHSPVYSMSGGKQPRPIYDFLQSGGFVLVIPPKRSLHEAISYTPNYAAAEIWVDPTADAPTGDDAGSREHPFSTLQAAVDAVTVDKTIIHALPGDYRDGGATAGGLKARVDLSATKLMVLLKAEEGPASTTIWGEADPETLDDETLPGCGPNAMRCICASCPYVVVQGFTLRDGHTLAASEDPDDFALDGAALGILADANWQRPPTLLDCVITNCVSAKSVIRYANTYRCRVVGNLSQGAVFHNGFQASSLVAGNRCAGLFSFTKNCNAWAWLMTCVDNTLAPGLSAFDNWKSNSEVYGSIVIGGAVRTKSGGEAANVVWGQETTSKLSETSIVGNPVFGDAVSGDYRPSVGGAAVDAVDPGLIARFSNHLGSDLNGDPIRVSADGWMTAGCLQANLPHAVVIPNEDNLLLVNGRSGACQFAVEDGQSVSVTISTNEEQTRYAKGFRINGVDHVFTTCPWSETFAFSEGTTVEAIPSSDWYVDASAEDNDGKGFAPNVAKKTLAALLTNCDVRSGDTVWVAPGTYDSGEMRVTATSPIACRAVVPAGVTLKASGSAEETIIKGAASPEPLTGYGQGTNAVRCVALRANAVVEGFTLTGGRTLITGQVDSKRLEEGCGAGAYGVSENTSSFVRYCVISNNVAAFGGGGAGATYVGCRFFGNRASDSGNGSALYRSGSVYDCVIDNNHGTYVVMYPTEVRRCTIGNNNDCRGVYYYQPGDTTYRVFNSVIGHPGNNAQLYWNCIVCTNSRLSVSASRLAAGQSIGVPTVADFKLDADLRPLKDSPAVDAGDDETRGNYFPETDLDGVPRVLNGGRFDIGAFEYDWRVRYAQVLGKRVQVTDVSSNVVESADGRILVPEGSLSLDWAVNRASLVFKAAVEGPGTLTVTMNGATVATLTEGDGPQELCVRDPLALNRFEFRFAGEGHAALSGFRRQSGMVVIVQ